MPARLDMEALEADVKARNVGKPTRVALIEDDAHLRRLTADWLRDEADMKFTSAFPDAESALKNLPAKPADVVLVDINLPGKDGVECVRRLKPKMPETQFVMVTVYEDTNRIVAALAAGATGYLLKCAGRDELLTAIREVNQGGSPMTSSIARKLVQSFRQPPPLSPEVAQLAPREQQVLELIAQGYVRKEIGEKLDISTHTIKTYIHRIYEKLHVRSHGEAVAKLMGR